MKTLVSCVLLILWLNAVVSAAPFIDDLSSTANFSGAFNGTTATSNGTTVTITRNAGGDAGIDWRPSGSGFFDTNAFQYQAEVIPSIVGGGPPGDSYDVDILFFSDNVGTFSSEVDWLATSSTSPQSVDVRSFAGATQYYFLRFRIQPDAGAGPTFTFDELRAVPEPASAAVFALGGIGMLLRRRRASVE